MTDEVRWLCAAAMIAVALYHSARLLAAKLQGRRAEFDVDLSHAAMGVAMALMLVGSLTPAAGRAWTVVFAVPTLWFTCQAVYRYVMEGGRVVGHDVRQAVMCAAMLYMIVATVPLGHTTTQPVHMAGMIMGDGSATSVSTTGPAGLLLGGLLLAATVAVAAWMATALCRGQSGQTRMRCGLAPSGGPVSALAAPRLSASCQLAMSATTAYMLVLML